MPLSIFIASVASFPALTLPEGVDPVLVLFMGSGIAFTLALCLSLWALKRTGVPVYSATPWIVRIALDMLQLEDGERFCDLGCGLGRVLRAARRRAKVTATGYELNPFAILYLWALGITDFGIRVKCRDFRQADLSQFDAVYLYLLPKVMPALAEQLERQLKPGARVVSVDFPFPDWTAKEEREHGHKVWLYVMGEHRGARGESGEAAPKAESERAPEQVQGQERMEELLQPAERVPQQ
ncbi:MAG: class I SAM-dependent methyltransferase [Myxococcales bacterium]|jgi:SAM-dependent methyltransferase|nr:class I SAM-dependent methyltransferase [Myxococcales bacterium]